MALTNTEQEVQAAYEHEPEQEEIAETEADRSRWPRDIVEAYQRLRGIYTIENADTVLEEEPIELYNGWLVWKALTDFEERRIAGIIQEILSFAARTVGFGQAYPDMVECELANGDLIKPDVCLVSTERAATRLRRSGRNRRRILVGGPELAIELRSPSNTRKEDQEKRAKYFANDTLVVWDVSPEQHKIWVWKAENPAKSQLFVEGDTITCPEVLPGWQRAVSDFFATNLSGEAIAGEAAQTWRAESRAEGEIQALQKMLLLQAQARFGTELPSELEAQLSRYNAEQLMALAVSIATSPSLGDWRANFPE